jgi:hypothetical protein
LFAKKKAEKKIVAPIPPNEAEKEGLA